MLTVVSCLCCRRYLGTEPTEKIDSQIIPGCALTGANGRQSLALFRMVNPFCLVFCFALSVAVSVTVSVSLSDKHMQLTWKKI